MRKLLFALLLVGSACMAQKDDVTTFILVRHAEKASDGTDDPDLNDEGKARAAKLSDMFKDTPLTAIYSTKYKRAKRTVQPIADLQRVDVREYETFKPDVIDRMVEEHRGGTVLVSGHSNTTPWTANLLVGEQLYKDFPETEYGIVLIVSVRSPGKPVSVVRVNY